MHAMWIRFVFLFKDVILVFFTILDSSGADFNSFQSYLLSSQSCSNEIHEALTSFSSCKLSVPHLNPLTQLRTFVGNHATHACTIQKRSGANAHEFTLHKHGVGANEPLPPYITQQELPKASAKPPPKIL